MDTKLKVLLAAIPVVIATCWIGNNIYKYCSEKSQMNQIIEQLDKKIEISNGCIKKYNDYSPPLEKANKLHEACASNAAIEFLKAEYQHNVNLKRQKDEIDACLQDIKNTPWYKVPVGMFNKISPKNSQ